MCGIAGFLAKRDGVDVAATLTAMLAALRGRGPDSTGLSLYGAPFQGDLVASAWAGEAGGEATRAAVSGGVSEAGVELSDQRVRDGYWRVGVGRKGGGRGHRGPGPGGPGRAPGGGGGFGGGPPGGVPHQ